MVKRRTTTQRIKILEYLIGVRFHPTAEDVYNEVKKDLPTITLATVYRNLNILADEGRIKILEIKNEYHYDADTSCHQHCVCSKCGKILDLHQKEISEYALRKIKTDKFIPERVDIIFCGKCK